MENIERHIELLNSHKLRKTPVRIEVLKYFLEKEDQALSHQDIEMAMDDSDRVTLYRTLKTFEGKGLIHQAIDGSGIQKFALCDHACNENHHFDDHPHFRCNKCDKTICMTNRIQHDFNLPSGYKVQSAHLVIQGLCNDCS